MKFRKKPVIIDAWQVTAILRDAAHTWKNLPEPIKAAYEKGDIVFAADATFITTLEGNMRAEVGDWIICGVKGELYTCKPDIFEATYEPVADEKREGL